MTIRSGVRDAYSILGVGRDSEAAEIAAAYHRLARQFHPDIAGEATTRRMMEINAAWDLIRTPRRRSEHDRDLAVGDDWTGPIGRRHHGAQGDARPTGSATHEAASRWSAARDGTGGAGPPPGRPSGTVLPFGRHVGWSIGEIARVDPGYLIWLEDRREGRPYLEEIDRTLRASGQRRTSAPAGRGPSGRHRFGRR